MSPVIGDTPDDETPKITEFAELEAPVNENIDAAVVSGMMVATIAVDWKDEKRAALLFSFATHDGQILPPIVYVGDDLKEVANLVTSAADLADTLDLDSIEV